MNDTSMSTPNSQGDAGVPNPNPNPLAQNVAVAPPPSGSGHLPQVQVPPPLNLPYIKPPMVQPIRATSDQRSSGDHVIAPPSVGPPPPNIPNVSPLHQKAPAPPKATNAVNSSSGAPKAQEDLPKDPESGSTPSPSPPLKDLEVNQAPPSPSASNSIPPKNLNTSPSPSKSPEASSASPSSSSKSPETNSTSSPSKNVEDTLPPPLSSSSPSKNSTSSANPCKSAEAASTSSSPSKNVETPPGDSLPEPNKPASIKTPEKATLQLPPLPTVTVTPPSPTPPAMTKERVHEDTKAASPSKIEMKEDEKVQEPDSPNQTKASTEKPKIDIPKAVKVPRVRTPGRKSEAMNTPVRTSKRSRSQTTQFQSPNPNLSQFLKKLKVEEETEKQKPQNNPVVFFKGEHLAVRNDAGGFYICCAFQNVTKTSKQIKIQWLEQKSDQENIYIPEYFDKTGFETILTSVKLHREKSDTPKKGQKFAFRMEAEELERIQRILKMSMDKESGKLEDYTDTSENNPDGLDISMYKDEGQLKEIERKKRQEELADKKAEKKKQETEKKKLQKLAEKSENKKPDDGVKKRGAKALKKKVAKKQKTEKKKPVGKKAGNKRQKTGRKKLRPEQKKETERKKRKPEPLEKKSAKKQKVAS